MPGLKYIIKTVLIVLILTSFAELADAIPVFARKYKTSCVTCHEVFPRLNATGEAFRLNGYKFLDDELYVKDEPVEMGDEAYKELWPDSIWPSSLPEFPPVAFILQSDLKFDLSDDATSSLDFVFPSNSKILAAGSFDENMSFFLEFVFNQGAGGGHGHSDDDGGLSSSLEGWLQFEDLLGAENAFNVRIGTVGMQEMGLFTARDHNRFTATPYLYSTWTLPGIEFHDESGGDGDNHAQQVGDDHEGTELTAFEGNSFMIHAQPGIEINGFGETWRYAFGIVNGNGEVNDNNDKKDIYGQLAFKFGGLPFDGSSDEDDGGGSLGSGDPWVDDSVIFSLFGYKGSSLIMAESADNMWMWNDDFTRFGPGLLVKKGNMSLGGGYLWGTNKNAYWLPDHPSIKSKSWFVEANFFSKPWLIPSIRYEGLTLNIPSGIEGLSGSDFDQKRLVIGAKALIRANVSLTLEGVFYSKGGNDQIVASFVTAF